MKQLKVLVKDKNTLLLQEDGKAGDYINLNELTNVDLVNIEDIISKAKDQVYEKKLMEHKQLLDAEHKAILNKTIDEYKITIKEKESALDVLKLELKNKHESEINVLKTKLNDKDNELQLSLSKQKLIYEEKINTLNNQLSSFEDKQKLSLEEIKSSHELIVQGLKHELEELKRLMESKVETEKLRLEQEYQKTINELKTKLEVNEANQKSLIEKVNNEHSLALQDMKLKHQDELTNLNQKINEKEMMYQQLQNQKSVLNIKNIGESLESWCDNEMASHMQNGLFNCTWEKDNKVVKEEGEDKGTKADYIFKIYANEDHNENELLASVCLDMKDENPDSKNKTKNSEHYATLHKNRIKKNCKYAVLVSNLELKTNNDVPIRRVLEYPDMYVIRPAYLTSFLGMITSLSMKFKDLLLAKIKSELDVKNRKELMEEFNSLKNTYFDKMIDGLVRQVEAIKKNNDNIFKAYEAISKACEAITKSFIEVFEAKLSTFEVKINRAYNKYEKTLD